MVISDLTILIKVLQHLKIMFTPLLRLLLKEGLDDLTFNLKFACVLHEDGGANPCQTAVL